MPELHFTRPLSMRYLRILMASVALLFMTSCASESTFKLEEHLGLYALPKKKCSVPGDSFDPCKGTLFFELVKGKFSGYTDDETVMVFWTGDPEADPELQYATQEIKSGQAFDVGENRLWLEKTPETEEYLEFSDGQLVRYFLSINLERGASPRTVEYWLEPASRDQEPMVQMNYPKTP